MTRKLSVILILSLLAVAFLAVSSFSMSLEHQKRSFNEKRVSEMPKDKLAGAERGIGVSAPGNLTEEIGLGADVSSPSRQASPGLVVGYTNYDYQHNGRMTREVEHRGDQKVHFAWMKEVSSPVVYATMNRGTGYNCWDPDGAASGAFVWASTGPPTGGCEVHPLCGPNCKYSGYVGLDVDPNSAAVIGAHYTEGPNYNTIVWYDFASATCFYGPNQCKVPDSVMKSIDPTMTEWEMIWPDIEYQVNGNDTVTHAFSQQSEEAINPSIIGYFRRVGDPTNTNCVWDYPAMCVDTVADIAQTVTASRVSGKVALVWLGNLPDPANPPGYYESGNSGSQVENDVFYAVSTDMGVSWGNTQGNNLDKFNITKSDDDSAGWRAHTDLSCLIDSSDYLHIVWDAREYLPTGGGTFPHAYGSRMFHWSDDPAQFGDIRVVADANWDIPDVGGCNGGAWNTMSMVKMNVSECEGKLYVLFVQFNDIAHGIADDCHISAFTSAASSGTANGELYLCVSDNNGYNWDLPRNLTNTYTPRCDTAGVPAENICESDQWPSMPRFGMYTTHPTGFDGAEIVDPSDGSDPENNYYLDIFYVNDKMPGGCVQDAGIWTLNPLRWFRVPCVIPVPNPVISFSPSSIDDPTWTRPGEELDTTVRIENIGNAILHISKVEVAYVNMSKALWMNVGNWGPINISHLSPNYYDLPVQLNWRGSVDDYSPQRMDGYIVFTSDAAGTGVDSFEVHLIVADSVQFPEATEIRTTCTRLYVNNAGNMGHGGNYPDGGFNMNFFDDCDTANNSSGENNNVSVYLYDASPFVLRVNENNDTVLNYYMFDADWLSYDGMRPLGGMYADSSSPDHYYVYSGKFTTKDSVIGLETEYYGPKQSDSCNFVVVKQKWYNNTNATISGVYLGDLMDWDIPSDTAVRNASGFDNTGGPNSRDLMYCYGHEYGDDTLYVANNCIDADLRYGGLAFYNGVKIPYTGPADSIQNPQGGWFTGSNGDWVHPAGGFQPKKLYEKLSTMGTLWETFSSTNPDSQYVDLCMVSCFGQYNIGPQDTLVFVSLVATTYDGGLKGVNDGIQATIDQARQWVANRPYIWTWPTVSPTGRCCYGTNPLSPSCEDITFAECIAKPNYISWDPAATCTQGCPYPDTGRCCYGDPRNPDCVDETEYECSLRDNSRWDASKRCATDPCPEPLGQCCYGEDPIQCMDTTYAYCIGLDPAAGWDSTRSCAQGDTCISVCDCEPGNANGDATINIFDITYIIGYLYLGGPAPTPYALCNGDPNCDCTCNIFDITYVIGYLYLGGPAPCDCAAWLAACGPPLRK